MLTILTILFAAYVETGLIFWLLLQLHPDTTGYVPLRMILVWSLAVIAPKLYDRVM